MSKASDIAYYILHPVELRSIIQWKVWHNPVHERNEDNEGPELKRCFYFLDKTSRSFAAVIKELNPELRVPITLFYLVLRGLDTIEDDMTIPLDRKVPELQAFHDRLYQDGWSYSGNHEKEKDRELLVEFHVVVSEFKKIKEPYQVIIKDIARKMGAGMAETCARTERNPNWAITIKDYEQYCHYAAGIVGEGLTRLFVESKLANPALLTRSELYESMGQFLQQTNIIRDIKEDLDNRRRFYPKEIWSKYVDNFEDLCKPEFEAAALNCSSEMILNALRRVPDCLYYLAGLRDQSVFDFAAIPQAMAIATLEECFRNPALFRRNVKITKGRACQLMIMSSQNLRVLCEVVMQEVRKLHKKNDPRDPNFLEISVALGKIEQFIEGIFPSKTPGGEKKAVRDKPENLSPEAAAKLAKEKEDAKWDTIYTGIAVGTTLLIISIILVGDVYAHTRASRLPHSADAAYTTQLFIAWMAGARFDLAIKHLLSGGKSHGPESWENAAPTAMKKAEHGEL